MRDSKNPCSQKCKVSFQTRLHPPGSSWYSKHEDSVCISPRHCLFPSVSREVYVFPFSFCNSFLREASDNSTQPIKVNALEGALVEAFSNGFPGSTTAHQGAQNVCFCKHEMRLKQSRAWLRAWCVAQKFLCVLAFSRITLRSSQGRRIVRVLVAENRENNGDVWTSNWASA